MLDPRLAGSEALLDALPDAALVLDDAMRCVAANAAAVRLLARSRDELSRLGLEDALDPPGEGIVRARRPDGEARLVEATRRENVWPGLHLVVLRDVTETRATEARLRGREAELRTLLDQSPYSIQTHAPDGHLTYANRAWSRLWGVSSEEMKDYNLLQDPQLEALGVLPLIRRAFEGETVVLPPTSYVPDRGARKGQTLWTQATLYAVRDDGGRVAQVVLLHEDVTERKVAEDALRESERLFRELAENIREVFWVMTPGSRRIVYVSPMFEEIWGRPRERLYADREEWVRSLHPADRERVLANVAQGDGEFEHEYRIVRPDGDVRWVYDRGFVIRDAEGHVHRMVGIAEDVTRRKLAEERLQERTRHLEALVQAQADLGDGVVIAEGQRVLWANQAYARLFGYPLEDVSSPEFDILALVAPEHREAFRERIRALAVGERESDHYETEIVRLDGTRRAVEVSVKAFGEPPTPKRVAILRDVTERRAAEAELATARAQLAQAEKLSALGSLVSGVAHEIRTPLTYLTNNLYLLQHRVKRLEKAPTAPLRMEVEECVRSSLDAADRIDRLVEDLRRFTRLKGGRREAARLDAVVAEAANVFEATARGRVSLARDLAPATAELDALEVQQVVLNLLQNAAESGARNLVVATRSERGRAVLRVVDDGPGIPDGVLARMWEPFFTTKPEGTGLGLAIVKRIVGEHGGTVEVASRKGDGTTFAVSLPESPRA